MKVKAIQSRPVLCDPMDYTVHGILQARILEWVAFPSPGDLPNPGTESKSSGLQVDSLTAEPQGKPAAAVAKSLQSWPTLCDPIDGSAPVSSIHGIFQARVLEWGAIAFSNNAILFSNKKE